MSYHQVSSTVMNYIIEVLKNRGFVDTNGLAETLAPIHDVLRKLEKRVLTLEAVITGKAGTSSVSSKKEDEAPRERSVRAREREEKPREEKEKPRRAKAKDLLSSFE